MTRSLLVFFISLFIKGSAFATDLSVKGAQTSKTPLPVKPIKVSELNANLFSAIYDFLKGIGTSFFEGFLSLKDFVETGHWLVSGMHNPEMREIVISFGIRLSISFFVGFAISQTLSSWLSPKINHLLFCKEEPKSETQRKLILASFLAIIPPLAFGFLLYTIFRSINPYDGMGLEVVNILSSGFATIWILLNLAHVFLKPVNRAHQHIPLSGEVLQKAYVWIRRMAIVALFGFFVLETGTLIDLPSAGYRLLFQISSLAICILAIFLIASLYEETRDWIRSQQTNHKISKLRREILPYLGYIYIPIIIFIVVSYMSWVSPEIDRFQTIIWKILFTLSLFPLIRIVTHCLRKLRIFCFYKYGRRFFPKLTHRLFYLGKHIDFITFLFLSVGGALLVLDLWGLNPFYFIFSEMGRLLAEKAFSIFIIIVVALLITRLGNDLLTKYLSEEKSHVDETQKQKMARFKTISSVTKNVLRIAVWTPAILLIIVELDVDVVPILATVGILSVGLSFGVQSLVKDLVTGFFMLLEDAFAVGDLVVINGQMGRIESLTVRVVRVRATDGSLYTFPYGSITTLCNQNRDFSAAVLFFQVGIEADISQVFGILEKISDDLKKDKSTRPMIGGSIEIDGVNEVSDHALEIRAVLKTKPGQHYKVKWAFNRLLKQYLIENGIPLATPRQVSYNYAVEK